MPCTGREGRIATCLRGKESGQQVCEGRERSRLTQSHAGEDSIECQNEERDKREGSGRRRGGEGGEVREGMRRYGHLEAFLSRANEPLGNTCDTSLETKRIHTLPALHLYSTKGV